MSFEHAIKEYVMEKDYRQVAFAAAKGRAYGYINTSGLISLLLACRLPEAKAFRKAVVSKTMMRPGRSGNPAEWTEADKQLADPEYPLRVLMQIIEAQKKKRIDEES